MKVLGKRLEVMKKNNEASLIHNEILTLESELRQLEFEQKGWTREAKSSRKKPKSHLPEIPESRRVWFETTEIPRLHLYDENGIDTGTFTPLLQSTKSSKVEPQTSAPSKAEPQTSTHSNVEPQTSTPSKTEPPTSTLSAIESNPSGSHNVEVKPASNVRWDRLLVGLQGPFRYSCWNQWMENNKKKACTWLYHCEVKRRAYLVTFRLSQRTMPS